MFYLFFTPVVSVKLVQLACLVNDYGMMLLSYSYPQILSASYRCINWKKGKGGTYELLMLCLIINNFEWGENLITKEK